MSTTGQLLLVSGWRAAAAVALALALGMTGSGCDDSAALASGNGGAGDTGQNQASGGSPELCHEECVIGATRCTGAVVELCSPGLEECNGWLATEDCSSYGQRCLGEPNEVGCGCGGQWTGGHDISDAASLLELNGYTRISGTLTIVAPDLTSLEGLDCLQEVGGDLEIGGWWPCCGSGSASNPPPEYRNLNLTTLAGLEQLTSVGGTLRIQASPVLESLDGLDGLTTVGGDFELSATDALTQLDGIGGLSSVGGRLVIDGTAATNVDALNGLTSLPGGLGVFSNNALTNLDGLSALTALATVDGSWGLSVADNNALTSVAGLSSLQMFEGAHVSVIGNAALPTCEATLLADLIVALGWQGEVSIGANSGTCP